MKVLVWATLFVAVTCASINQQTQNPNNEDQPPEDFGPWQKGRLYTYEVQTQTLASLHEGSSSGSATKAQFQVYAKSPRHLQAKLLNPKHAQVHQDLPNKKSLPEDLKYEPVQEPEQPFEIYVNVNRVEYLRFPQSLSFENENLLKGLISTLQSSISPYRAKHGNQDNYDMKTHQGQFRKMETDVTGDCETLYVVSPLSAQNIHREIPEQFKDNFATEITMTKDYGKCNHRVAYHFGVPTEAEWTGTAQRASESQFMKRLTHSRMIAGVNGIYKAETTSTVHVSPLMYGKQKAEVYSKVSLKLISLQDNADPKWVIPENMRKAENLLYTLRTKSAEIDTRSSSSSSSEESRNRNQYSNEYQSQEKQHQSNRVRRESLEPQDANVPNYFRKYLKERTGSSSSSSSSSSESNESSYVNDDMPNERDPAYSSFYMTSQWQDDSKDNPMSAQKLAQEIAQQIQNPNAMPKADTLSKFNVLVRIISAMNKEQLGQTSRSIENAKSSNNAIKMDIWMVYRDAVAQAGTIPAFQQIKTWIYSKKIQNEEAAQVVATLASTLRYPTKEVMKQFFELSSNPEVREQMYLNSTVLISATHLINLAYVNQKVASSRYPTQMYGRLTPKKDDFVEKAILPRLQNEMDEAIARGDSHRAQVSIKAIGNLGHEGTLQAFAPYLEGKIPASTYLRRFMVENLDLLAYQKDHATRSALYSLLKNTAEPNEVRVAAVLNIFISNPSPAMMQGMAQMTNDDPSRQVRAAIKSGIQSAAQLKDPRLTKLARSAQEVLEIVSKESYSPFYSWKQYYGFYDAENDLSLHAMLSKIASDDGMLAKYAQFAWRQNNQEWNNMNRISAAFSDPRQSIENLKAQLYKTFYQQQNMPQEQHKLNYSPEKVAELLNFRKDQQTPLQAAFSMNLANQQRFFTLNSDDMQRLPHYLKKALQQVSEGYDYHYTKVFNRDQVTVMFPLISGMPFIYNYKAPILVHLQGKAKGQVNFDLDEKRPSEIQSEVQFTYAKNIEGSVGFYDTLSQQHASAGIVSKSQIYIPIKVQIQVQNRQTTINMEALRPEQETTILHSSFWPYTSSQKKNSISTVAHEPTTKVINREVKTSSVDTKFGPAQTGMQFQLNGYSYSKDHRSASAMFKPYDVLSAAVLGTNQRDMALSHYNLKYVGKQSPNKRVTVTINYDETVNRAQDQPLLRDSPVPDQKDTAPKSDERRQEMLTRVSSGIKSSSARVLDLSVSFKGSEQVQYVLTAAIAKSEVDPNIQYALFAAKNSAKSGNVQANAHGLLTKAQTIAMNLADALKQSFKTTFNAYIKIGEKNGNIQIDGSLKRSQKNVEYTEKNAITRECMQQMKEDKYYQPACQTAIQSAHIPDQLKVMIGYKDISSNIQNMFFQAYSYVRGWVYEHVKENIQKRSQEGKLELEALLSNHRTLDINVNSRIGELKFENIPVPKATYAALTMYSPLNAAEVLGNYYLNQQFLPYCAVESKQIKTFSNRSYEYPMTKAWHVVMLDDGKYGDKLVVMANRPSEKQQQVYIAYQSQTGENFELRLKPEKSPASDKASVEVQTKLRQVSTGAFNSYYWSQNQPAVVYYAQLDGVMVVNIDNEKVRMLYDGQSLVIYANDNRHSTKGICGQMTGEPNDDYITSQGYVDNAQQYAASYALNQNKHIPETDSLQKQAKENAYPSERHYTSIIHSDKYWNQYKKDKREVSSSEERADSQSVFRVRSYKKDDGECQLHQQVQYFERHDGICISLQPMPSCSSQCHGEYYSKRLFQVACRPRSDQEFRNYADQIRQGHNPQVPDNGTSQMWRFRVPSTCRK